MDNNSFLSRWAKRKLDSHSDAGLESDTEQGVSQQELPGGISVADTMDNAELPAVDEHTVAPAAESGSDSSDNGEPQKPSVAALLASQASQQVKKAALRQLFLSGEFSEVDRLNDYDHDYSKAKTLSTEVAQGLRDWLNKPDESPRQDEDNPSIQSEDDSTTHAISHTDSHPALIDDKLTAQEQSDRDQVNDQDDETQIRT